VDITENMKNLKEFIKIRDTHDAYRGIRGRAMVGIPMLKIGDEVMLGPTEEKLMELFAQA
jgi:glutaredoxin-related protein